jgi:hypothetical protein
MTVQLSPGEDSDDEQNCGRQQPQFPVGPARWRTRSNPALGRFARACVGAGQTSLRGFAAIQTALELVYDLFATLELVAAFLV